MQGSTLHTSHFSIVDSRLKFNFTFCQTAYGVPDSEPPLCHWYDSWQFILKATWKTDEGLTNWPWCPGHGPVVMGAVSAPRYSKMDACEPRSGFTGQPVAVRVATADIYSWNTINWSWLKANLGLWKLTMSFAWHVYIMCIFGSKASPSTQKNPSTNQPINQWMDQRVNQSTNG